MSKKIVTLCIFSVCIYCTVYLLNYTSLTLSSLLNLDISDAGVRKAGSCFLLVYDTPMSWSEAKASCIRLGGVLASLGQNSTRWHLQQIFRFHRARQFSYYLGLKSTPEGFHSM